MLPQEHPQHRLANERIYLRKPEQPYREWHLFCSSSNGILFSRYDMAQLSLLLQQNIDSAAWVSSQDVLLATLTIHTYASGDYLRLLPTTSNGTQHEVFASLLQWQQLQRDLDQLLQGAEFATLPVEHTSQVASSRQGREHISAS